MRKILVVDDEPDITASIKKGLEKNGFSVETYNDPLQAVKEYRHGAYDLMIIDIKMPKMNGFEFYREIKKKNDTAKICFFTAFEIFYDEFKKVFPNLEVKCFIRKPISINDLVTRIDSELNS